MEKEVQFVHIGSLYQVLRQFQRVPLRGRNTGNGTILLVVGMDMYFVQGRLHLFSGHWQEQPADMWPVG
ncbi:hypothetical protein D4759_31180 [Clostridiales bacterium AHG0011]|uniref:Uncharacterized protein n=1 Tax=Hungatella hathewayi TaxID=154046 RepID=A0A3E4TTR7_9FIRM|nr:hypothetical protein [Enterocloster citroniae]MCC3399477.1 hypothetical protein [Clostridiales bacterium AHG0011]RGL94435.1 hypothetical protein DXC39_29240 [Hungatella hathewayi]RHM69741.1 hypothetical protein DWZ48_29475 [Hungatella hathewayi]